MRIDDLVLDEELRVVSGDKELDRVFMTYIKSLFTDSTAKKIDRVFDGVFKIRDFKERGNVMCYTQGTNIYINKPMFEPLMMKKKMSYLMHEFIHVMDNSGKFPELKKLQDELVILVSQSVPKADIPKFLTGKKQNIHSDWRKEVITYLNNDSIDWSVAKKDTKEVYKEFMKRSGIFNMDSYYWKKRFDKKD